MGQTIPRLVTKSSGPQRKQAHRLLKMFTSSCSFAKYELLRNCVQVPGPMDVNGIWYVKLLFGQVTSGSDSKSITVSSTIMILITAATDGIFPCKVLLGHYLSSDNN